MEQPEATEPPADDPNATIKLTLVLKSGSDLLAADKNGLSDPFVKMTLGETKHKSKVRARAKPRLGGVSVAPPHRHVFFRDDDERPHSFPMPCASAPQVIKKTLNPEWNETFTFTGSKGELLSRPIEFHVRRAGTAPQPRGTAARTLSRGGSHQAPQPSHAV